LTCSSPNSSSKLDCPNKGSLEEVSSLVPKKLKEPSGVVFNHVHGTLFVVGDQGDIEELELDGTSQNSANIDKRDFEGITYNPQTGLLYVVEENKGKIYEIDPYQLKVRRSFSINWDLDGEQVLNPDKEHIEGITFVPDSTHEQGGLFYIANRSNKPNDKESPSALFELELQIASDLTKPPQGRILKTIKVNATGLSGLQFDAETNTFKIANDDNSKLLVSDLAGNILECYDLPGKKQEGVTITHDRSIYIADDKENTVLHVE
jgi:uncharacterized protein YjiK